MIEFKVFYDDCDGIKSQAGWYYFNGQDLLCGPFYTKHQAQSAADEDWNYEGC